MEAKAVSKELCAVFLYPYLPLVSHLPSPEAESGFFTPGFCCTTLIGVPCILIISDLGLSF